MATHVLPIEQALCAASAVGDGECVRVDVAASSLVILRANGSLHAYLNCCPHQGTELDWLHGAFFDAERKFLQCATHGALFRPTTGECVAGPCKGHSLQRAPVIEESGIVYLLRAL